MMISKTKKSFSSILFAGVVSVAGATTLSAGESYSLVGIEGGFSGVASEVTDKTSNPNTYTQDKSSMGNFGLKVGAESKNYRIFLNGRYYSADAQYDSLATYGVDLQYKFNFSSAFNIFVGAGAGMANVKFNVPTEAFTRTISDPYYSGDIGINVHINESFDFELGGRYMSLEAVNSKSNVDYTFNNIVTGYASIIYKYQLD